MKSSEITRFSLARLLKQWLNIELNNDGYAWLSDSPNAIVLDIGFMLTLFTPRKCSRATTSLTEEKPSLRDRVLLFSLCYGSPAAQTSKGSRSKKLKVTHRLWCCCYTRRQWAVQVLEKKTSDDIHVYYYKVSRGDEDWKHHRPTESTMRYGRLLIHYTMSSISVMGTCDMDRTITDDGNAGLLHQLSQVNHVLSADFRKYYFSSIFDVASS